MSTTETPLSAILKGAVSGLAGTAALSAAMEQVPSLLEQVGLGPSRRGEKSGAGGGKNSEQTVEKLAGKVAGDLFDAHLSKKERKVAGQVIHWAYGAGWGTVYGVMQSTFRFPPLLLGTLLAGLMGLTAATIIPSMRVAPQPKDLPLERNLLQLSYIFIFGWVTALVFSLLSRKK